MLPNMKVVDSMEGGWTDEQKRERVRNVVEAVEEVYGRPRLILRFTPMEELISCIMSQNSADAKSFPAFTHLRETFQTWQDVVDAGPERVADVIRGAGLANQKSKAIVGTLTKIYDAFGDYTLEPLRKLETREALTWLMELPGVGPKTASLVLCFAMGRETVPVDTHVYRVSWRLGLIPETLGEKKAHDVLIDYIPSGFAFRFHLAFIQHGRTVCKAPRPVCGDCAVTHLCQFFQSQQPS